MVPLAVLEACAPAWVAEGNPAASPAAAEAAAPGAEPADAAVALSRCLLGVGGMCLEEAARPVVSPRCGKNLLIVNFLIIFFLEVIGL